MNRIYKIFTRLDTFNPNPQTELIYKSTFELLIAVMLSAQSTDVRVNLVTQCLFKLAKTPAEMLELGLDNVKKCIQSLGLFNTKAANIIKTCALLLEYYQGQVPSTREALESLPGVGRKTANVILNTAFGQPTLAVDTHIFRVAHRLGLARGKTPRVVEAQLLRIIPQQFLQHAHHALILHGRYVCTARKPNCDSCIIMDLCTYQCMHK